MSSWWDTLLAVAIFFVGVLPPLSYMACRLRLAPVFWMRLHFAVTFLLGLVGMRLVSTVIDKLRYVPGLGGFKRTSRIVSGMLHYGYGLVYALNPHINIKYHHAHGQVGDGAGGGAEETDPAVLLNAIQGKALVLCNHTSFSDGPIFCAIAPYAFLSNTRTIIKSTLYNLPIFGPVYHHAGSFPVFFKRDTEAGNFTLDKERQAPVAKEMADFIDAGGSISFFAEGQIAPEDPTKIQKFRYGMFRTAVEHKMPMYQLVMRGCHETWPVAAALGGWPADVQWTLRRIHVDYEGEFAAGTEECEKRLAERMEGEMQRILDELIAINNSALEKKDE